MTHSFSSRARCLAASNRDALAQGVGAAASALVDVWKAFAGPDTPSPAATEETHAESAESAEPESHAETVSVVSVDSVVMSTGRNSGRAFPSTGPTTDTTELTETADR